MESAFGYDFSPCFQEFEIYRFSGTYKIKATSKRACIERWASAVLPMFSSATAFHLNEIGWRKDRTEQA